MYSAKCYAVGFLVHHYFVLRFSIVLKISFVLIAILSVEIEIDFKSGLSCEILSS